MIINYYDRGRNVYRKKSLESLSLKRWSPLPSSHPLKNMVQQDPVLLKKYLKKCQMFFFLV